MDPEQELAAWVQLEASVMLQRKCLARAEDVGRQLERMRALYELKAAEGRAWLAEANRLGAVATAQVLDLARAADAYDAKWSAIESAQAAETQTSPADS